MNEVLARIIETKQVSDGIRSLPLSHPDFPSLPVAIDPAEGQFLQRVIADVNPRTSLEIGCAYGVSTLYICEALASLKHKARHIVLDPFQSHQWCGIGVKNVRDAGYGDLLDFHEQRSELALPRLLEEGVTIQFALVDGWHTFDQVMVEFFYLNRMLDTGGVLVFDDADRRSVNRVIRHALTYPAYRVYGTEKDDDEPPNRSALGRVRLALASVPAVTPLLRSEVLQRDWDLGIFGTCVAIQKVGPDERSSGWDCVF